MQPITREDIITRLSECETVSKHIDGDKVWQIFLEDCKRECQTLDDNWQNIGSDEKLKEARILKMAYNHIFRIKDKYNSEMQSLQEQLKVIDNNATEIHRDYDTE